MFNGNQMEGGIGPGDLKACLLKSSLLGMGVGEGGMGRKEEILHGAGQASIGCYY